MIVECTDVQPVLNSFIIFIATSIFCQESGNQCLSLCFVVDQVVENVFSLLINHVVDIAR